MLLYTEPPLPPPVLQGQLSGCAGEMIAKSNSRNLLKQAGGKERFDSLEDNAHGMRDVAETLRQARQTEAESKRDGETRGASVESQ